MIEGFNYIDCKLLSHDRMFYVYTKSPDIVYVELLGGYPKDLHGGLSNVREVLFQEIYEDSELYLLMQGKCRKRSKRVSELCKNAITNSKEDLDGTKTHSDN